MVSVFLRSECVFAKREAANSTLLVQTPPLVADVTQRDDICSQPVADQQHTVTLSASVTPYLRRTLVILLLVKDRSVDCYQVQMVKKAGTR